MQKDPISWLYPPIEPHHTGTLKVSSLHEIYFEESGNPKGKPVVFVHGGPGGGTEPKQRRFFDPRVYRIVLFDQRGCGKSAPGACIEENTTWDLVSDMERIRELLKIDRWQVFGGSWGSTLALAYAQKHPQRVTELVLRGIFLMRKKEIEWFYQKGADALFPDEWEKYLEFIPLEERGDLVGAYHKRLTSTDPNVQIEAAKVWAKWEAATSKLYVDSQLVAKFDDVKTALAFSRIESHYFVNGAFLEDQNQLLRDVHKIQEIPCVIVQGRYDIPCPMDSAWALHRAWPEAELMIIPDAGHSAFEPGISRALVAATDRFGKN